MPKEAASKRAAVRDERVKEGVKADWRSMSVVGISQDGGGRHPVAPLYDNACGFGRVFVGK